jgi:hypothetical protein
MAKTDTKTTKTEQELAEEGAAFIAVYLGERFPVRSAGIGDLVAFERHFHCSAEKFQEEKRVEFLAWLAWHIVVVKGRKLGGPSVVSFDLFLDGLEDIEINADKDEADASDPQPAAPSA